MNWNRRLLISLIPALLTFLVYIPSLGNGFVNWDDPFYVFTNENIRSLGPDFFRFAMTGVVVGNWHPLTMLSYAFDYSLWQDDPFGYHLVNNIFHSLNAGLVFLAAFAIASQRKASLFVSTASALIAAVLFGIHPQRVESVAWISERKDVLCAFFVLLSLLSYIRYSSTARKGLWYSLSIVFFALALMSKPMAVTLPIVLLIIDHFPFNRLIPRLKWALLEKAPFFALSAVASLVTILAQRYDGAMVTAEIYPFWMRAVAALKAFGFYIFKSFFPSGLAPFYPLAYQSELFDATLYASVALMIIIVVFSIIALRRTRSVLAAALFYAVTLLPVIGLVQVGGQAAADRYTYIPLIGPLMLAGAGIAIMLERAYYNRRALFFASVFVLLSVSVVLAGVSVRQMAFWKDSLTLWNRQIELYPGRVPFAYNMRGLAYDEKSRYIDAVSDFNVSITLDPMSAFTFNNRANAQVRLGNYRMAVKDYLSAITLAPNLPEPYSNLSIAYYELGEVELANEAQRKARALGGQ